MGYPTNVTELKVWAINTVLSNRVSVGDGSMEAILAEAGKLFDFVNAEGGFKVLPRTQEEATVELLDIINEGITKVVAMAGMGSIDPNQLLAEMFAMQANRETSEELKEVPIEETLKTEL